MTTADYFGALAFTSGRISLPISISFLRLSRQHGLPLALYVDYHSFFFTQSTRCLYPARLGSAFLRSLFALRSHSTGQRQDRALARLLAKTPARSLRRRANRHPSRRPMICSISLAPSSQCERKPSRTPLHPASRLEPCAQGETLRPARSSTMPLVALCLEPALPTPKSIQMAASPSPANASASIDRPDHRSLDASIPTEITPSSPPLPPRNTQPVLLLHCPAPSQCPPLIARFCPPLNATPQLVRFLCHANPRSVQVFLSAALRLCVRLSGRRLITEGHTRPTCDPNRISRRAAEGIETPKPTLQSSPRRPASARCGGP